MLTYPTGFFSGDYNSALRGCWPLKFLHTLQLPKMHFKSYLGRQAASCWALPHISSIRLDMAVSVDIDDDDVHAVDNTLLLRTTERWYHRQRPWTHGSFVFTEYFRQTDRQRQTDKDTDRRTEGQTERQAVTHRETRRQTDRQTNRQTETNRQKYRQTDRQRDRQSHTERPTDTNRQTKRQTDKVGTTTVVVRSGWLKSN